MDTKRMAFHIVAAIIALGLCFGGGFGLAFKDVQTQARAGSFIDNGNWYTDRYFGSTQASAKVRAYVAIVGLLALSKKETVYYMLHTTDDGHSIQPDGIYEIVGTDLPARWWSITLYNDDHFLVPNEYNKYSVRASDINKDGSFKIILSKEPQEGNWIPLGDGKDMSLILRLYNPESWVVDDLDTIKLPSIRKIGEVS